MLNPPAAALIAFINEHDYCLHFETMRKVVNKINRRNDNLSFGLVVGDKEFYNLLDHDSSEDEFELAREQIQDHSEALCFYWDSNTGKLTFMKPTVFFLRVSTDILT